LRIDPISTARGQSLLLVCTNTTSLGPMLTISKMPSDATARVQAYPAAFSSAMERCSLRLPLRLAFIAWVLALVGECRPRSKLGMPLLRRQFERLLQQIANLLPAFPRHDCSTLLISRARFPKGCRGRARAALTRAIAGDVQVTTNSFSAILVVPINNSTL